MERRPAAAAYRTATQPQPQPQPWFESAEQRTFAERLRSAARRVLLLDYDGTLAPFHVDKTQAFPYPGVAQALDALAAAPAVRLVLVTGRRAGDLERLVPVATKVEIWGSHGRERISAGRDYTLFAPGIEQNAALDAIQLEIEAALDRISLRLDQGDQSEVLCRQEANETHDRLERKPASLAVHWRGLALESQHELRATAQRAFARHTSPLIEDLAFESGVEFRATGCSKGSAVQNVLSDTSPDDVVAYLGDDITDEDAFVALRERGLSILVRAEARPTNAVYWLRPPHELIAFLTDWTPAPV